MEMDRRVSRGPIPVLFSALVALSGCSEKQPKIIELSGQEAEKLAQEFRCCWPDYSQGKTAAEANKENGLGTIIYKVEGNTNPNLWIKVERVDTAEPESNAGRASGLSLAGVSTCSGDYRLSISYDDDKTYHPLKLIDPEANEAREAFKFSPESCLKVLKITF